ncbi:MAG: monovalent cation/H+ antiporter subunit D [Hydrogenovibrio sp.]|uniref:monovalent cation/H+ antiporter subunit D n=1 Tax=Hydrogenovibrio sp. TaxID=2065821 RepID=UPI0028709F84|nr:monovalent cation/H+ antiporter subunit D [Hydrogenovibrio sp.]MDR9498234.1 monovalent cation/H+ antiporter subunit D [Hydrogenovibrio sp.]
MTDWPSLPFLALLLPLLGGTVILLARPLGLRLQRVLGLLLILGLLFVSVDLLEVAFEQGHRVYALGNWAAPYGIVLVLDPLSAMMVSLTSVLALAALWYAMASSIDRQSAHFHVLFQIQLFGLNGAFLTGDVFNLFVFFEVLLLASYGLLLHGGGRLRTRGGLHYVVINLIGSTLFLFAVGALYGILGTLNIADMAQAVAELPASDLAPVAAAGLLLLVVFAIKAAFFPLYLWLPGAYANTSAPVAALFAIMTKVGVYAIIRVHGTVFGPEAGELAFFHQPFVLTAGLIGLGMAAFGVLAARGLKNQVAYLVLASVATLLVGVGLNTPQALGATLYYLIHSTLIAAALFLLADILAKGRGPFADRFESAPPMPNAVWLGGFFLFGAVAMTGMPPLSGFMGKVFILDAALAHDWAAWVLGMVLVSSLLMIVAMARSGSLLFYNTQETVPTLGQPLNAKALVSVTGLFVISLGMVVFAGPILGMTQAIADSVYDVGPYLDQVLNAPTQDAQWLKGGH